MSMRPLALAMLLLAEDRGLGFSEQGDWSAALAA